MNKTGINKKENGASGNQVRYFNSEIHNPGFLGYGPTIPYSKGFMIADFNLKFKNLKTKIKPLCQIDIFSISKNKPLAAKQIKPGDIKKVNNNSFRLATPISESEKIEFRIQTTKLADISFDYIDLKYYQGVWIKFKNQSKPVD